MSQWMVAHFQQANTATNGVLPLRQSGKMWQRLSSRQKAKKRPHLPLFPLKAPHNITLSWYFTVFTVDFESYLDDPGGLLTHLYPPLNSLKVFSSEIITVSRLQMSNAGNHCRTGASSPSWVKLGGASYLHSMMADSYSSGGGAELSRWIRLVKAWTASFSH